STSLRSFRVQKKSVQEFQGQHLVDLVGVVPVSLEVASHHGLELVSVEIRSGKSARVQEHFPNVAGERIPVPDPKMIELVPPEEEAFEAEGGKEMVDPS